MQNPDDIEKSISQLAEKAEDLSEVKHVTLLALYRPIADGTKIKTQTRINVSVAYINEELQLYLYMNAPRVRISERQIFFKCSSAW